MNLGESVYRLKSHLQSEGIEGLAVDLDDTSYHTSDAYHDLLSERFPSPEKLTRDQARKHFALTGKILYWGGIPEAKAAAYSKVDDPEFHSSIMPITDAIVRINELEQKRLMACYLTARTENLRWVTEVSLTQHNFPRLPLGMKSKDIDFENSAEWKAAALDYLFPHVNGIIDNDARVARALEEMEYSGRVFLIGVKIGLAGLPVNRLVAYSLRSPASLILSTQEFHNVYGVCSANHHSLEWWNSPRLNEQEYLPNKITTPAESWSELIDRIIKMRETVLPTP